VKKYTKEEALRVVLRALVEEEILVKTEKSLLHYKLQTTANKFHALATIMNREENE
jgi:hypothetical protein